MAKDFDRRWLLSRGCAMAALVSCAGDSTGTKPSTGDSSPTGDDDDTTPTDTYPCNQTIDAGGAGWEALPLSQYPDLETVGGWYGVTIGGSEIVVAHIEEGCYSAILRACAHEGVAIDYVPSRGQFVCPLHGAVYDEDGNKVAGPAPTGLPVYPCGRDGDTIWVKV